MLYDIKLLSSGMEALTLKPLDYAQPAQSLRPASLITARVFLGLAIVSVSVGVLILLAFRITGIDAFVGAGLWWLMIGGGLTSLCLLTSIIMLSITKHAAMNGPQARKLYGWTIIVTLCSYPIAFGCVVAGGNLAEGPHFRLRVYNDTSVTLQRVTADFNGKTITVGPVAPGKTSTSGLNWSGTPGDILVTLEAAGQTRTFRDRYIGGQFHLQQPYFDIHIEPVELPKPLRP